MSCCPFAGWKKVWTAIPKEWRNVSRGPTVPHILSLSLCGTSKSGDRFEASRQSIDQLLNLVCLFHCLWDKQAALLVV